MQFLNGQTTSPNVWALVVGRTAGTPVVVLNAHKIVSKDDISKHPLDSFS